MSTDPHLQLIQSVIGRLAGQSMTVKGWCVTVTAALLGFGASTGASAVALIAVYVVLAFAVLDAYYHALQRAYRVLYDRAVAGTADPWTMVIDRPGARTVLRTLRNPPILLLYGSSLLATLLITLYVWLLR